jgi:hypothetical protein
MTVYNHFWNPNIALFYNKVINLLEFKQKFDFVFISKLHPYNGINAYDPWPELREKIKQKGKQVIIFLADDEYYTLGDEYIIPDITVKVFKHYVYFGYRDHPIIRPIPLPTNVEFDYTLNWNQKIFDYSFMGTNNYNRGLLKEALQNRQNDGLIKFISYNEDSNPITNKHYYSQFANILNSTKLSLCPPGWRNNECYRTIESAQAGCVILASELLSHWFHEKLPYIKVYDWSDMSIIDEILSKPQTELRDISIETRKWYEDFLSPKAVANYVTNEMLPFIH